ncbi:uncharacterized protein LOC123512409 [Portunus trituberculatus]|uniref:uncharacterized protein LOC123512409 n=1 Tax=Portunus trituberculatus TaxID=210409 RepID=UPI001E1D0635|nr:uncharacterized protein LOC123512409 [Portunus trituberculatus]
MVRHILIVLAPLLLCGVVPLCIATVCSPSCIGHSPGDKVPDPLSCYRYYYCKTDGSPTDSPVLCPDNAPIFDAASKECNDTAACHVRCLNPCQISCKNNMQLIGDTIECGTYYLCIPGGVQGPFYCSSDTPFFSREKELCVADHTVCCDKEDRCVPMCEGEGTEIIDPRDCRNYYVCTGPGVPLDENHHRCPEGQVFDVYWGSCSADSKCYTLCYH